MIDHRPPAIAINPATTPPTTTHAPGSARIRGGNDRTSIASDGTLTGGSVSSSAAA